MMMVAIQDIDDDQHHNGDVSDGCNCGDDVEEEEEVEEEEGAEEKEKMKTMNRIS